MSDAEWYFGRDGSQGGPVPEAEIRRMLAAGELRATDLAWRDGMDQWQPAGRVAELASAAANAPLRPPPLPARGVGAMPYAAPAQPPQWGPPPRGPDIGQDAGMRMLLPVGRSGWAIASGYLGLLSLFPIIGALFGIGAVITAFVAFSDIKRNPERHGMGRAIFGLIAGGLGALGWGIALIAMIASAKR
jgi:hypothetical protein